MKSSQKQTANGLMAHFTDDESALRFLETQRWPNGPVCPHCGVVNEAFRLQSKPESKNKVRPGLWKCKPCRKTFTAKMGTIFEDSHIPLSKWLFAIHLLCASKKGMSAHQLHRMLGVSYKSAWFMAHRIRYAMKQSTGTKLTGTVEVDETYIGGKRRNQGGTGRPGKGSHKSTVVSLIQRDGSARSFHVKSVSSKNLKEILNEHVSKDANVMTDDFAAYDFVKKEYDHDVIRHGIRSYARRDGAKRIHTNSAEGFFSLLKRGITGTFHHVSKQHLHRYLAEFDFRYSARNISDVDRALLAVKQIEGKRLTYHEAKAKAS